MSARIGRGWVVTCHSRPRDAWQGLLNTGLSSIETGLSSIETSLSSIETGLSGWITGHTGWVVGSI